LSLNQASHIADAALGKARELELRPLTVSALDPAVIRWWRWAAHCPARFFSKLTATNRNYHAAAALSLSSPVVTCRGLPHRRGDPLRPLCRAA
jgi:hypothetical protein